MIVELAEIETHITKWPKDPHTIGRSSLSQLWYQDAISGGLDTGWYELSDVFHVSKAKIPLSSNPKRWPLG